MCNSVTCRGAVAAADGKFAVDVDGTYWKCAKTGVNGAYSIRCIQLVCRAGNKMGWYDSSNGKCYGRVTNEDNTLVELKKHEKMTLEAVLASILMFETKILIK